MLDENEKWDLSTCLLPDRESVTGALFFIIECAAFSYSVLRRWGYRLHYPIAALIDNLESVDEIAKKFGVFQTRVLNLNLPPVVFNKSLEDYKDDLAILLYTRGRYVSGNIETLTNLCASGGSGGLEMNMPLLILFLQIIPEEYQEKFPIVIEIEQMDLDGFRKSQIEHCLDRLRNHLLTQSQIVRHEISKLENQKNNRDYRFWSAVVTMIAQVFAGEEENAARNLKEHLYAALQKAFEMSESYEFNQVIPQLFQEAFDKSIPEIISILPEARSAEFSAQELGGVVLYDSSFYYIPADLFIKICEPIRSICTVNQVKDVLARRGILCTQGQGRLYRTIKKKSGSSDTPMRFVWLKREELEENGMDLSYVDLYQVRRGGRD